jgi:hypothetical protein
MGSCLGRLLRLDYLCPLQIECGEALVLMERIREILAAALSSIVLAPEILAEIVAIPHN